MSMSMSAPSNPPPAPRAAVAAAPFDEPAADLVLRSSDGVRFHVFRAVLALASPVLADMLSLPHPSAPAPAQDPGRDRGHDVPVVDLAEDSTTLDALLRLVVPCARHALPTLHDALAVLEAARKYDMPAALRPVQDALYRLMRADAVGAYAVAARFGFDLEAQAAAQRTLRTHRDAFPNSPLLAHISGAQYHRLLDYHRRCGDAAGALVDQKPSMLRWLPKAFEDIDINAHFFDDAFDRYREAARRAVAGRPCGAAAAEIVHSFMNVAASKNAACAMHVYSQLLASEIDKTVDGVRPKIT